MSFESLGLSAALLLAVSEQGYDQPTAVQRAAIPDREQDIASLSELDDWLSLADALAYANY